MASLRFLECLANLFGPGDHAPPRNDLYTNLDQTDPGYFGVDTLMNGEPSLTYSSADDSDNDNDFINDFNNDLNGSGADHVLHNSGAGFGGGGGGGAAGAVGAVAAAGCAVQQPTRPTRRCGPCRRRVSSVSRVAFRWRLTPTDAQELCEAFEAQQGKDDIEDPALSREPSASSDRFHDIVM